MDASICSEGKPPWERLRGLRRISPVPRWPKLQSQLFNITDKLKKRVIQLQEPSKSCVTLSPSPQGA